MARKFNFNWDGINAELKKEDDSKKSDADVRFYKPQFKDGKFGSVIRFLPPKTSDSLPRVKYYEHFFRDKNGFLIEKCPTTFGGVCPVCESNSEHWNSGDEGTAKRRKRNMYYISNIYVVKDENTPTNEGKVFLYRYGVKIKDIIDGLTNPSDEDDVKIPIWDYYDGANFKLDAYNKEFKNEKTGQTETYPQYDKSKFKQPSEFLGGDDDKIGEVHDKLHDLDEFINKDNYKSYEELANRLSKVTGIGLTTVKKEEEPKKEEKKEPELNKVDSDEDFMDKLMNEDG